MKVSELFNPEKLHNKSLEVRQYMEMTGTKEASETLENDIGPAGSVYNKALVYFYPNRTCADLEIIPQWSDGIGTLMVPCPNHGRTITINANMEVDDCYIQPMKDGSTVGQIHFSGLRVYRLHYDSMDASKSERYITGGYIITGVPSSKDGIFYLSKDIWDFNELDCDEDIDWIANGYLQNWGLSIKLEKLARERGWKIFFGGESILKLTKTNVIILNKENQTISGLNRGSIDENLYRKILNVYFTVNAEELSFKKRRMELLKVKFKGKSVYPIVESARSREWNDFWNDLDEWFGR